MGIQRAVSDEDARRTANDGDYKGGSHRVIRTKPWAAQVGRSGAQKSNVSISGESAAASQKGLIAACLPVYPSACLSVYLSTCPSVYPSACLPHLCVSSTSLKVQAALPSVKGPTFTAQ